MHHSTAADADFEVGDLSLNCGSGATVFDPSIFNLVGDRGGGGGGGSSMLMSGTSRLLGGVIRMDELSADYAVMPEGSDSFLPVLGDELSFMMM